MLVTHLGELVLDHRAEHRLVAEDGLQLLDPLTEFAELLFEAGAPETGEANELHVEDVVRLTLAERHRLVLEGGQGGGPVLAPSDQGDDLVDQVEGPNQTFDDVLSITGLTQPVLGSTGHHFDLVTDVGHEGIAQVESAGHPIDDRHHVHGEAALQRGVLEQVVQDDVRGGVSLELDDEAGLSLGRLVAKLADSLDDLALDGLCDLLLDALH